MATAAPGAGRPQGSTPKPAAEPPPLARDGNKEARPHPSVVLAQNRHPHCIDSGHPQRPEAAGNKGVAHYVHGEHLEALCEKLQVQRGVAGLPKGGDKPLEQPHVPLVPQALPDVAKARRVSGNVHQQDVAPVPEASPHHLVDENLGRDAQHPGLERHEAVDEDEEELQHRAVGERPHERRVEHLLSQQRGGVEAILPVLVHKAPRNRLAHHVDEPAHQPLFHKGARDVPLSLPRLDEVGQAGPRGRGADDAVRLHTVIVLEDPPHAVKRLGVRRDAVEGEHREGGGARARAPLRPRVPAGAGQDLGRWGRATAAPPPPPHASPPRAAWQRPRGGLCGRRVPGGEAAGGAGACLAHVVGRGGSPGPSHLSPQVRYLPQRSAFGFSMPRAVSGRWRVYVCAQGDW
mmetsp:Transcript_28637/g.72559  ORF Transcript_28637/g.72559 Transcript_28637/m.72559 type:complete len:404 (-) Transcript_28637:61-1272(-)